MRVYPNYRWKQPNFKNVETNLIGTLHIRLKQTCITGIFVYSY